MKPIMIVHKIPMLGASGVRRLIMEMAVRCVAMSHDEGAAARLRAGRM